ATISPSSRWPRRSISWRCSSSTCWSQIWKRPSSAPDRKVDQWIFLRVALPASHFGSYSPRVVDRFHTETEGIEEDRMDTRLHYAKTAPGTFQAMDALEDHLAACGLDEALLNLIKLRASQINGCAYCIDMHWKDLRAAGETEQRLYS